MKVALIGNMNNNFYSFFRYFKDLKIDVELLIFKNEPKIFNLKNDEPNKVNKTTLALPSFWKTVTIALMVFMVPSNGLNAETTSHPIHIPVNKETKTCLVFIAKKIATTGGNKLNRP